MRRSSAFVALIAVVSASTGAVAKAAPPEDELPLAPVDDDDDDANGIADNLDAVIAKESRADLVPLDSPTWSLGAGSNVRVIANGKPLAKNKREGRGVAVSIQGLEPGRFPLTVGNRPVMANFIRVRTETETGAIDVVRSGLEVSRTAPSSLDGDALPEGSSAFREVLVGDPSTLPQKATIAAISATGTRIDALVDLKLHKVPCADGTAVDLACVSTPPLRLVLDDIDRSHPLFDGRALVGELGGAISVSVDGRKLGFTRVRGPRTTEVGPIDRMRATLRVFLVRDRAGGGPPFGSDDETAIALARAQVRRSNALWAQCGVSFGAPETADVRVVDPPKTNMVAVGCDVGLPATGGDLRVKVEGKEVKVAVAAGDSARVAARKLARALEAPGRDVRVSENARIGPGAAITADVAVRRSDGTPILVEAPERGKISGDATLTACVGAVDLTDGLQHFADVDAVAGTLEERSLLRAFDDGDSGTVEVVFVPSFATGGRIGESFIRGDHSSISNMLIEDRAGVRADRISFAMAHELGHVLLDLPGHTDDFGVDTPTLLMDSDAADPSAFGPRRISTDQCARAVRQSGPSAMVPVLAPWPLGKMAPEAAPKGVSAAPRPPQKSPTSR